MSLTSSLEGLKASMRFVRVLRYEQIGAKQPCVCERLVRFTFGDADGRLLVDPGELVKLCKNAPYCSKSFRDKRANSAVASTESDALREAAVRQQPPLPPPLLPQARGSDAEPRDGATETEGRRRRRRRRLKYNGLGVGRPVEYASDADSRARTSAWEHFLGREFGRNKVFSNATKAALKVLEPRIRRFGYSALKPGKRFYRAIGNFETDAFAPWSVG